MEQFNVVLQDHAAKVTSEVYASRNDIVCVQRLEDIIDGHVVKITLTPDFGPDDYLVRVVHKNERTEMTTLAGKTPTWAGFPDAWRDWVNNESVRRSAESFVRGRLRSSERVNELFDKATHPESSVSERKTAWVEVAKLCGVDPADVVGTGSKTATQAMPIRIAQKLSKGKPIDKQWKSPLARPEYANPFTSGRVRVAPTAPKEEEWLFRNPEALGSVQQGLKEAAEGKVAPLPVLCANLGSQS